MTADEYTYFVNNKDRFELLWKKYVDIDGIIDIQKYFNLFEEFYKDNVERNRIFVEKITGKKVAKEEEGIRIKGRPDNKEKIVEEINRGKKIKVVITGGFHTYGFTKLLEDNGIDYCVITPNITEETLTAEKLYENVFKEQYKLQNQTFQKMLVSQVIGLLNKGEIASVTVQGENVLINYANNNETINLKQPETETDKMVSKADAEKIAKIFAKTFFTEKAKFTEKREQARKDALGVLQDKGIKEEDAFLVLSETLPSIKNKKTRAILAAVTETLLHPIYTFFDSEEFAAAHYDFKKGELEKLKTGTDEEKGVIYNKYFGLKERLEGARSIKKTGWISFAATGIISLVITAIIFLINPLSAQAIIIGIVIDVSVAIVAGYIGAMVRHIVYNIKVLKSNLEGFDEYLDEYLLVLPKELEKLDKKIKEINEVGIDISAKDYKKKVEKLINLLVEFHSRKDVKGVDFWDKQAADIFKKNVLEYVEQQRAVLMSDNKKAGEMSDNKKAGLKIGDNFFPMSNDKLDGSLSQKAFLEKLRIIPLSDILKQEEYLKNAKKTNYLNMQLNGGAGSSVKRDRWLKCLQFLNNKLERRKITDAQYQEKLKTLNFLNVSDEEIKDIKVNLGAKAADMYFRINVGTAEKPKYELKSITDVKLNELLEEIKQQKYASVSVVMLTSAPSVNLIEKSYKSGGKNIKEDINRKDGRFIKQIFGDKDVAELAMMLCGQYPPVYMGGKNNNIFKFRLDKEAPSGHGVWLKTILEKIQETAENFTICISNSDAVNSGTPAELVGYMVEKQKGIMVIAATREAIDRKGGIIGLKKITLDDGSVIYVPAIMEIAQARAIGENEEKLFQAMGFDKYEGQVAFNTNTVLINANKMRSLMDFLQGLVKEGVITQEYYEKMALPDLIKNGKGKDNKEYYQLEGALVSGVFNLNEKIEILRKKAEAKNLDVFMKKNFPTGLIGITLASKEQRTQIFTPFKFAPDFWMQFVNGNINKETWLWEPQAKNKEGATNVSTPTEGMYADVSSLLRFWRDCDIKELKNLYINSDVKNKKSVIKMNNVVLKGNVTINNDTDQELLITHRFLSNCGFKSDSKGNMIIENDTTIEAYKEGKKIMLKVTKGDKTQIYDTRFVWSNVFDENSKYIFPYQVAPQTLIEKATQWLEIAWSKVLSIFKKTPTIIAVVDVNDKQAIEEAKVAAKDGVKVELVFVGKKDDITKVLLNDLELKNSVPTEETGSIGGATKNNLSYELQKTNIENLKIRTYEPVIGAEKGATAKDTINNVLKQLDVTNKNVVYVSSALMEDNIKQQLNSAVSNKKLLAYSTNSIKSAMVKGIMVLKGITDKALKDMTVRTNNIMAVYNLSNIIKEISDNMKEKSNMTKEEVFKQKLDVLKKREIKTIILEMTADQIGQIKPADIKFFEKENIEANYKISITEKDNIDEAIKSIQDNMINEKISQNNIVIDLEKYSEDKSKIQEVLKQFKELEQEEKTFRYKLPKDIKPEEKMKKMKVVVNYKEAIEKINRGMDISNDIVMINNADGENIVINTEDIQKLIKANVSLAFDAQVINDIDSQDTSKNGITMLEIIKSMFTQTPEAKLERLKAKGKIKGREFALNEDILKEKRNICSFIMSDNEIEIKKYVENLTGIQTENKEEAKAILTGIIEVMELRNLTNKTIENLRDDISDNANKLLEMLGQYRLLTGKSYITITNAGKKIINKYSNSNSMDKILDILEQNLKQENATSDEKAAVLEGIIYLLLSSRLEVGKYTSEKMDINISNINAMLSAA